MNPEFDRLFRTRDKSSDVLGRRDDILLKIALFAYGPLRVVDFVRSPSVHTAPAAVVYGGLAAPIDPFLPAPIVAALVVVIAMYGYHLYAEAALRTLAARYASLAPFCTAHGFR